MIHIINSSFFVLKINISQLKPTELTPPAVFLYASKQKQRRRYDV